jgi:transketolase
MGVGMAWAARYYKTDSRTYVLLGDGETAEGSVWEAAALSAHQSLNTLTAIVDINEYGQSGATMQGHDVESHARRFAAFGWQTIRVDGHDVEALDKALSRAQEITEEPCVILAKTTKGKGVSEIEGDKGKHGKPAPSLENALNDLDDAANDVDRERELSIHPTDRSEGFPSIGFEQTIRRGNYNKDESIATRAAFGRAMLELGEVCPNLAALDGDVKNSTKLQDFFDRYPDRSIECYIAEQNMIGTSIGLGKSGLLPCAVTFAAFLTRAFDQIRMANISRSRLILAGSHAGVAIGQDGPTQMGLEDLAMMHSLVGSLVLYPSDANSTYAAVENAAQHEGIAYIRLNRGKTPTLYDADESFGPGTCKVWNGSEKDQATLIGAGMTLFECLDAQKTLAEENIPVRVIDCYSVKPVDQDTLRRCAEETGVVIVVEDHHPEGGIGEAVFSAIKGVCCQCRHLAVDKNSRSGAPGALFKFHGISSQHICEAVRQAARP